MSIHILKAKHSIDAIYEFCERNLSQDEVKDANDLNINLYQGYLEHDKCLKKIEEIASNKLFKEKFEDALLFRKVDPRRFYKYIFDWIKIDSSVFSSFNYNSRRVGPVLDLLVDIYEINRGIGNFAVFDSVKNENL